MFRRNLNKLLKLLRFPQRVEERINVIEQELISVKAFEADSLALNYILAMLPDLKYFPITNYSLRPYAITHIINDVIINRRKFVVEFGSGSSTLLLVQLLSRQASDVELVSVDHDHDWIDLITSYMPSTPKIRLLHAGLTPVKDDEGEVIWYDWQKLERAFNGLEGKIDLVIVDGPPEGTCENARAPVIEFINEYLSMNGAVLIDDTHRSTERHIANELIESYGFHGNWKYRYCFLTKKAGFDTSPIG